LIPSEKRICLVVLAIVVIAILVVSFTTDPKIDTTEVQPMELIDLNPAPTLDQIQLCAEYECFFPASVEFSNGNWPPERIKYSADSILEYDYTITIIIADVSILRRAVAEKRNCFLFSKLITPYYNPLDTVSIAIAEEELVWLESYIRALHDVAYRYYADILDPEKNMLDQVKTAVAKSQPWESSQKTENYSVHVKIDPI